ncbi:MAG: hypothetical protein H7Z75_20775 [Ferruginibacter sp.]|nr:hypothetical protein [Cytophagales bacterium]
MKSLLILNTFLALTYSLAAQSQTLPQNNQWLEKQLNLLTKDKKDDPSLFRFQDCQAKMEIKTGEEGMNFGMSLACNWNEIKQVSYRKEGGQYKLTFDIQNAGKEVNNFSFSLKTSEEKLVQEIKKRVEQNRQHCLTK